MYQRIEKKNELLALCQKNLPQFRSELVERAYNLAYEKHKNDKRASGEPYFWHPYAVAKILLEELPVDDVCVICALLHDVVEDNEEDHELYRLQSISQLFGTEISFIVDGLTKIKEVYEGKDFSELINVKKLLLYASSDLRVIFVKLADRLQNMRELAFMPQYKRKEIANQTVNIYIPIARYFGLGKIKCELEDLAFKEINCLAYDDIRKKMRSKKLDSNLEKVIEAIEELDFYWQYSFVASRRDTSVYSIYRESKQKSSANVTEEIELLIDSEDKIDCYRALGLLVSMLFLPLQLEDRIGGSSCIHNQYLKCQVMATEKVTVYIVNRNMKYLSLYGVAAMFRNKDERIENYKKNLKQLLYCNDLKSLISLLTNTEIIHEPKNIQKTKITKVNIALLIKKIRLFIYSIAS